VKKDGAPKGVPVASGKKPYQKPAFKYGRAFETMALSCGKASPTQGQCNLNTKSS
jgi:N-acetylmuramic acid 6-phosphate (MurNAc-6-P) etherase